MKTIKQALSFLTHTFQKHRIPLADRQAEDLLCNLLLASRQNLYLQRENHLTEQQWQLCQDWLNQRLEGVPLQYLCGYVEFYNCLINVNKHVLIPRQETEIIVDKVVQELKRERLEDKRLLDLCCGSGCIAIALKKRFPHLEVYASDLSSEAVEMAKKNALRNQVEVKITQGNLLEPFKNQKMHYFICNPPYISSEEYLNLEKEVLNNEPSQALLAGETGLEFYMRLAEELPTYLSSSARVWLEIGYNQGKAVEKLFQHARWVNQKIEKDWAGLDRLFSCQLK